MDDAVQYLKPLLPYATLLTVAVGITFGIASAVHGRRLRHLTVAAGLVQSVQSQQFTSAVQRILELPQAAEPEAVLGDPKIVHAAYTVRHVFEGIGVLVFHRLLPLKLVDDLIGGYLQACWVRLAPFVAQQRSIHGPTFAEWFQWLAERVAQLPHGAQRREAPAAVVHMRGGTRRPAPSE